MTDELSPEARALLGAARGADDPADADRERVRGKMLAAIGAGAAATTAGTGAAHAAPSAPAAGLAVGLIKLALVVVGVAAVATIGYFALRSDGDRAPAQTPAPAIAQQQEPQPEPEPQPQLQPEPEPEPEPEIVMEPETAKPARKPKKPPASAPEPAPPAPPSAADSLKAERALLARATAALRAGDPDAALAALGEHQKKFPHGVLEEERAASTVLALCDTGRTSEGKKARDRFLSAWPRSVHASRVRAACAP